MSAPTVAVTVDLFSMLGVAYAGVEVSAKLNQNERYADGFVLAETVTALTDINGRATLHLFPNHPTTGLGQTGSVYTFKANPEHAKAWKATAQVPNSDCSLEDIADADVEAPLTDAQIAVDNAQAHAVDAGNSASDAADSAAAALASKNAAKSSEDDAETAAAFVDSNKLWVGPTPPTNPPVGREWFNTTNGKRYGYYNDGDSYQWVEVAGYYYVDATSTLINIDGGAPDSVYGALPNFDGGTP